MKVLIDMNLSPRWVASLRDAGHVAEHWSTVGAQNASDQQLLEHAARNDFVVLTHDLDFGTILAATGALRPSVIQIRSGDLRPEVLGQAVTLALAACDAELRSGALVTLEPQRRRITLLPLRSSA